MRLRVFRNEAWNLRENHSGRFDGAQCGGRRAALEKQRLEFGLGLLEGEIGVGIKVCVWVAVRVRVRIKLPFGIGFWSGQRG